MKLKDKVSIITGAGKGMGIEISRAFAREGAHMIVCGRTLSPLEEIASEISKTGSKVLPLKMDVTDEASVESVVKRTVKEFGRLDIFVNASGVIGPIETRAIDVSVNDFENVWRTNTLGVFITNRAALKVMIPQKEGRIVNIVGGSGLRGYPMRVAYSSSKFGAVGITKTLAIEVGKHNIRVNAVCPGITFGDRMKTIVAEKARVRKWSIEQVEKEYFDGQVLGRWLKPTEMATATVFLASDDSSAITGVALAVDGGWAM